MHKKRLLNLSFFMMILVALFISIFPDIYRLSVTPAGTTFPLIHNYPNDYFGYLGYMHMGLEGRWLVTNRVTSEHFSPQFVYTFFVLLGHLSRITGISLPFMYFGARILSGIFLMASCLILICRLFKDYFHRLTACLFVFFGTGFWTITLNGQITINQFLSFWTHFDPILRTTFLPHHTFSTALGVLSISLVVKSIQNHSFKDAVLAGLMGFVAGIVYHGTMTNILGAAAITIFILLFPKLFDVLRLFLTKNKKRYIPIVSFADFTHQGSPFWSPLVCPRLCKLIDVRCNFKSFAFLKHFKPDFVFSRVFPMLFIYIFLSSLSLLYIVSLTRTTWPWTISSDLSRQFTFQIPFMDYAAMLGPVLILSILAIPSILSSESLLPLFLFSWALFPFLGLFMLSYLVPKYGNMPYMEATSYIPLGMLAVFGVQKLELFLGKRFRKTIFFFFFLLLVYFIPPHIASVFEELKAYPANYYNKYIPGEVFEGFAWLDKFSSYQSVVLAGGFMGSIIPAYSHNYLVYGDMVNTYNSQEKYTDMLTFFLQKDPGTALSLLRKYQVSYVFYAPDTDRPEDSFVNSLPLQKTFQNRLVTIYKVQ